MKTKHAIAAFAMLAVQGCAIAQVPVITNEKPVDGETRTAIRPKVDPDLVLLENGKEKVTARDFDAAMTRFPAGLRDEAAAYPAVIMKNIDAIFVNRVAADRARDLGLDKDVLVQQRMKQVEESFLAQKYLDYVSDNAKVPDLEPRALELYKADPKRFTDAPLVGLMHLVVSLRGRTPEMAMERAKEAEARLKAGEDFSAVASLYSDDPAFARHKGNLGLVKVGDLEEGLREGVAALKVGETSRPIVSRSGGVHIVRVTEMKPARLRPFSEVKAGLVEEEAEKVRRRATEDVLAKIRNDPANTIHGDRVESLRSQIDTNKVENAHRDAIEKIHSGNP